MTPELLNRDTPSNPSPVSPVSQVADGSFFMAQDTGFFDSPVVTGKPLKETKASQLGFAAAVVGAERPEDMEGISYEVTNSLMTYGDSDVITSIRKQLQSADEIDSYRSIWTNDKFLTAATLDPQLAMEVEREAKQELASLRYQNESARIMAEAASKLTPAQRELAADMSFVTEEIMYQQQVDQLLANRSATDTDKASFWNWVSLLNPLSPVTSRYDQGKLNNIIADSLGQDPTNYAFKSEHAENVRSYFLDPNITVKQAIERVNEAEALFNSIDYEKEGINPLWSSEFFDVIRSDLNDAAIGAGKGAYLDALELPLAAVDAAAVVKGLGKIGTAVTARIFGKAAVVSNASTPAQVEAVLAQMQKELKTDWNIPESGTLTKAPEAEVPVAKSKLSVSISNAIQDRGSMLDTIAASNPTAARTILSNVIEENPSNIRSLGVDEETLTQRIIPNSEDGLGIHAAALTNRTSLFQKFKNELDQLNPSDLLTNTELVNVPSIWAKAVNQHSTGTMFSTHSELVRVEDTGDIVVRGVFGASVDGGYPTLDSAQKALTNMFDGLGVVKVRVQGSNTALRTYDEAIQDPVIFNSKSPLEFFVETTQTLKADPTFVSPFEQNWITPMVPGSSYLVAPSRRIQQDLYNSVSFWADRSNRIASLQYQMLKPVNKLGSHDKEVWTRLLLQGDEQEEVYGSIAEAEAALGTKVSAKAWEAYQGVRDYYDSVALIRQRQVFKHLQMNGYRTLRDNKDAVVSDLNGLIHVRPIYQKPSIVARPADGTAELFTPDNVWGKTVWDHSKGKSVELTNDLIKEVYESGHVIARVGREAEFLTDELHEFMIVPPAKAKPLINNPMNIRKGHVDIYYAGEDSLVGMMTGGYKGGNSFKLTTRGQKTVGGVPMERLTTIGLYRNAKQAREARDLLIKAELQAGKTLEEAENLYPMPEATREGLAELGLDTAGTFTGVPAHARKRGDVNIRTQGGQLAETLSLEETLGRSISESSRLLKTDAVEMLKKRFAQTYAQHMEGFTGFHNDFERFVFKAGTSPEVIGEARRSHDLIENMDHALSNRQFVLFADKIQSYAQELMSSDSYLKGIAGTVLNGMSKTQIDTEIKKLVATLIIAARPLYQITANTLQAGYLFAANPVIFAGTIRRTMAALIALPSFRISKELREAAGAVLAGMSPDEFKLYLNNLRTSGIMRTSAMQDALAMFGDAGKVEAGRHAVSSATFWKRNIPGLGGVERFGKALMMPQHVAMDFANLMAYNHSFGVVAAKTSTKEALSRRSQSEVSGLARRLSFNQNKTDQFAYQQNALSLQLMFFQHVHRMYMDLIADPMARALTGNKLKVSRDGTNPYAKDWLSSVKTMGIISGMWGLSTYPIISDNGITEYGNEVGATPEAISLFSNGLVWKGLEQATGMGFNVESRFSPKGAVNSMMDMMFTKDDALVIGGPVNYLTDVVSNMGKLSKAYWSADPVSTEDVLSLTSTIASKALTGTNDFYRAMIVDNIQMYVDSSGRPMHQVTDTSWIPVMFSLQPDAVSEIYRQRDAAFKREDAATEISKLATRWAMDEYAENPTAATLDTIWFKGMRMCEVMSGDDKALALMAKKDFLQMKFGSEELLQNLVSQILTVNSSEDAKARLQELLQVMPESVFIQNAIKNLGD